ncbi:hypothetical protein ACV22Y_19975 [Burkholderia sp. AW50-3]
MTIDKSRADALIRDYVQGLLTNDVEKAAEATKHMTNYALAASAVELPAAAPAHKPNCASLNMLLLTSPPKPAPCDCGGAAPAASPVKQPAPAPAPANETSYANAYPETNLEVIEKAQYCLKHGETESVENWLELLHERLGAMAAATPADGRATIPEPTDDVLCACGWETWNSLGSYVDRGTATARYRTIAAFVLEGISIPAPLAQPDASQTRGAQ